MEANLQAQIIVVTERQSISKDLFLMLFIALLPALFTLCWCVFNTQLPVADGSDYTTSAGHAYLGYKMHGIFHLIKILYLERGWRPVTFPLFLMPFLIISKGNMFFSYTAVSTLCIFLGTIYVYLLLNMQLTKFSSAIGACIIGLLPLLQHLGLQTFFAEVAMYPALFAFCYYLIKSDFLRHKGYSIAVAIALVLTLTIRPVEGVTHLALILAVFFYLGWRKKIFSIREIYAVMVVALIGFFLLIAHGITIDMGNERVSNHDLRMNRIYVLIFKASFFLTAMAILPLIISAIKNISRESKNFLIGTMVLATVLIVLWWLPYIQNLTEWTYQNSVGGLAQGLPKQFFKATLHSIFWSAGIIPLLVIVGMALFSSVILSFKKVYEIISTQTFYYLFLIFPLPFILMFSTVQSSPRKIALAIPCLFAALMLIGMAKGKWLRLRNCVFALLLCAQVAVLVMLVTGYDHNKNYATNRWAILMGDSILPMPVLYRPNPHDVTVKFIQQYAKAYGLHNIAAQLPVEHNITVDPFLLSMMVNNNGWNVTAGYPYYAQFSKKNEADIRQRFDGLLLINPFGKMQPSKELAAKFLAIRNTATPWEQITFDTLYQFALGKIGELGWVKGPCYTFKTDTECEGCLFLRKPAV